MIRYTFIALFIVFPYCYGQNTNLNSEPSNNSVSLTSFSDEELLRRIDKYYSDTLKVKKYAAEYIRRAKVVKDSIMIARGFDRLSRMKFDKSSLKYIDSILKYTQNKEHRTYPSLAYTLKAHIYQNVNDVSLAMDNYILAYEYSNNQLNKLYNKQQLLNLYYDWGSPKVIVSKSYELLDETINLNFEKEIKKYVRKSIIISDSLIAEEKAYWIFNANDMICVSQILSKDFSNARIYLDRNKNIITNINNSDLKRRYKIRSAELDYYDGNYISCINKHIDLISVHSSENSLNNSYFYLGASYMKLGQFDKGLYHLKKLDSILTNQEFITRDFIEMYEILKNYYSNRGDIQQEVQYLNKLIHANNLIFETAAKISPKYQEEFETPQLLAEKEKLIAQLEWEQGREKRKQLFTGFLLLLSLGATGYYFWKQRQYKKRFATIVKDGLTPNIEESSKQKRNEISAEIVEDILKKLERFESKHQFTRGDVSLQSVAKRFNTNSSYLSKVVNLKKDKNFSQYISELRITYAVDQLQYNPRFRKYTIKAIAEEVGFGNAQSFSKAFKARTGLHPSYFIRNLNKQYPSNPTSDSILQTE
ncbi:helix-turn-helix domain-containing protein [Gilvibacter sp.]|uniref:helix-turn-helix domain-containing protein n=1 Tax=Gilvibacter sp. TaxID=2729997 RepID=UPI003F4A586F